MSPLALDPREQLFRTMLALSVGFHGVLFFLFVLWTGLSQPSPRFIPVAVVDLVGGPGPEPRPAQPEARPAAPSKGPSRERVPAAPRARAKPERTAKADRSAKKEAARVPRAVAPESRELSERIRKMREAKASEEHVREALGTLRKEKEARAAVSNVRERVAHRVDLSALRSPPDRTPPPSGGALAGGGGSSRVPPEQLEYFRALYEKIYESWVLLVPGEGRTSGGTLVAQIRLKIEKNGKVTDVKMEKGSGNRFFDESVLRAINKASPLPVPPERLRGGEDYYEVGFRFREPKGAW